MVSQPAFLLLETDEDVAMDPDACHSLASGSSAVQAGIEIRPAHFAPIARADAIPGRPGLGPLPRFCPRQARFLLKLLDSLERERAHRRRQRQAPPACLAQKPAAR